jgi:hypothetical protein
MHWVPMRLTELTIISETLETHHKIIIFHTGTICAVAIQSYRHSSLSR